MKVYVTRLRGSYSEQVPKTLEGAFASLAALKRMLVDSGEVSRQFAEQTADQFINHSVVTIETKGFAPYSLEIRETELIED